MSDSDAEDEKFAKNVMDELSAFQVTKKPTAAKTEDTKSVETTPINKPDESPTSADSEPPKPPTRIIKLSRPVNPYSSARTAQGLSISVSNAPSGSTASATGSTGSTVPASGAPGSRLAALQRPGSPMQRFLQRSKSPALAAAAARLGQQNQSEPNNSHTTSNNAPDVPSESGNKEMPNTSESETTSAASSLRSTLPPRIQSSGLTSSILLRRPQSPLRTSRTSILSKQSSDHSLEDGPISPRSPPAEGSANLNSPTLASEEAQNAEKEAIRNKLRANSFRLKDLLTKRPFVKPRSHGDSEAKDDNESDQSTESSEGQTGESSEGTKSRDRTRWRVDGTSLPISHRSRLTERTSSILSSRTSYARSRNTRESAGAETDNKTALADNNQNDGSVVNNHVPDPYNSGKSNTTNDILKSGTSSSEMPRTPDNETVTVGATLVRSPRTRVVSLDSTVPSNSDNMLGHTESNNIDSSNSVKADADVSDKISKTISDLEKEKNVNLVFDSENMGQTDQSPENETSHDARQSDMSSSMYAGSQSQTRASSRPRVSSEPATPITEQHPLTNSQSFEKSLDAEFLRGSPSLKRSFAVTDLDKAMQERDKQKLSSIFKESSHDQGDEDKVRTDRENTTGGSSNQLETDLDDRHTPGHRLAHSPRIQHKLGRSLEEWQSQPTSPPVNPVAPMVYKPNVNLEDAVKWPIDLPGKLDFKTMEVFEGQMLLNWLANSVDKSHYLRLVMTKHDINVIACQICTCLLAAGVLRQLESKDAEHVFKTDCMYYWTHTQQPTSHVPQDVNKLTPMWPPTQEDISDTKPGLKYTEADHQTAMVKLRHEYNEEVGKIQVEQKGVLDRARDEYETRLQQSMERIVLLQKEVEKYKCLAGIEKLTQDALSDANAARLEAGLQQDGPQTNGFLTPMTDTPSVSQYHTPAVTPDGMPGQYPINIEKSPAELFPDLTTPAELRADGSETSRSETSSVSEAESVAPPAPPPPPGAPPPPAPPPPPAFGVHRSLSMKPVVNPSSPMKPLFWQRLQLLQLKTPKHKEYHETKLLWEEIQEENIDMKELDDLFSKTNIEPSRRFLNKPKSKTKQPAKVISPKRSQTIGILLSSLRVEMSDIEYAILNFDTSLIGEDKLRHIYENRGDSDEMKKLKEFVKKHPDTPLDKPDQFLYDLTQVPDYVERIFCFIFREAFQESISVIDNKMTNLKMTCQTLMTSTSLKRILGLVLALGNYMNGEASKGVNMREWVKELLKQLPLFGVDDLFLCLFVYHDFFITQMAGSKQRGQADGFGIEILPKLKDVKSKDNSTSLLHYTVMQYVKKYEKQEAGTERVKLPLPDPSDMNQACHVNFDELEKELKRIKKDFEAAEEKAQKVISAAKEHHHLQPFKDIMTNFFDRGRQEFRDQEENIVEGKKVFKEAVVVFCVKPKSGDKEVTPEYFFSTWCTFCKDFKDIWKREQQRVVKIRIKENEMRVKKMQESLAKKPVRTRTRKPGGLKDRLAKQGLLES